VSFDERNILMAIAASEQSSRITLVAGLGAKKRELENRKERRKREKEEGKKKRGREGKMSREPE
jgi:hypothetical protein